MAAGTPITAELKRGESGISPFPLTRQENINIGYVIAETIAALANIELWRRRPFMVAYVIAEDKEYQLQVDLTTWIIKNTGLPSNIVTEDEIFDSGYFCTFIRSVS